MCKYCEGSISDKTLKYRYRVTFEELIGALEIDSDLSFQKFVSRLKTDASYRIRYVKKYDNHFQCDDYNDKLKLKQDSVILKALAEMNNKVNMQI
jgi:hypothetical protein